MESRLGILAKKAKNIIQSIPYLLTLFALCVGIIAIIVNYLGSTITTDSEFSIIAISVCFVLISLDIFLLSCGKKNDFIITPTSVVLFLVVFIAIFPFALTYFIFKIFTDSEFMKDYLQNEYPNKVETIVYQMSPRTNSAPC